MNATQCLNIKSVHSKLSEDSLLEQCLHGKTQNPITSLNAIDMGQRVKEYCFPTQNFCTLLSNWNKLMSNMTNTKHVAGLKIVCAGHPAKI